MLTCPNLRRRPFHRTRCDGQPWRVANQTLSLLQSTGPGTVPNVVGESRTTAEATLTAAGFVTGSVSSIYYPAPADQVLTQFPAAGATALLGSAITLQVSLGLQPQLIPDLVGLTLTQARTMLVGLGFTVIVNPGVVADRAGK